MAIRGGRSGGPGGGGRSHFGGSSLSSGGRSHSSSSSNRGGGHRHSHHHGGGILVHIFPKLNTRGSTAILVSIFFFFIGIMMGISVSTTIKQINFIKQDYNNYQVMIENAMNNPALTRTAVVTEKYIGNGGKWYIRYEYDLDNSKQRAYDESFAHYTKEELSNYKVGQTEIVIVTESSYVDEYTITIPMDYYNSGVENDGEYIELIKKRNTFIMFDTITFVVAGLVMFLGIKTYIKYKNKETEEVEQTTQNSSTQTNTTKTHTKCPYCGARVSSDKGTCTQCGAGLSD